MATSTRAHVGSARFSRYSACGIADAFELEQSAIRVKRIPRMIARFRRGIISSVR